MDNGGIIIRKSYKNNRMQHKIRISSLSSSSERQRGHVAVIGIVLMVAVVIGVIGFAAWSLSQKDEVVIQYSPPQVTADDQLSEGKSSKELVQDVKILEAGLKRADGYKMAADVALTDRQLSIGTNTTATTVEQERLSQLQTDFIAECDRRLGILTKSQTLLEKLTDAQRPVVEQLINKEVTDLNGVKARVAATASQDAFDADRQVLNQEYLAYLLAISQLNLLVWANDQVISEDKFNVVGGKFQERINAASNNGSSTAASQTALNSFQASKVTAGDLTTKVIRVVPTIRAGEQNANRSVLKTYFEQLSTAHNEMNKALVNAKLLAVEAQKFDRQQ